MRDYAGTKVNFSKEDWFKMKDRKFKKHSIDQFIKDFYHDISEESRVGNYMATTMTSRSQVALISFNN